MRTILILYPKLFGSFSKFERKISNILKNTNQCVVIYPHDLNKFIYRYTKDHTSVIKAIQCNDFLNDHFTHVIVFDDGEEFTEEIGLFKQKNIPIREIKIKITRVINIKKNPQFQNIKSSDTYEYIGRGSYWGNPYAMFEDGDDREEVIRKFKYDFDKDLFPKKKKEEAFKLIGKKLGCFCKPEPCHGDILANFLNSWDDCK